MAETIVINGDGTIEFVYSDTLAAVFDGETLHTTRASHVEPEGNGWQADMGPVDGPVLHGFKTRQQALDAERAWLREEKGL